MTETEKIKKYKKTLAVAKAKLDYFTIGELENFIKNYVADKMYPQPIEKTPKPKIDDSYNNLKTCLDFRVLAYNNAYLGEKSKGGETYKRCVINISNSELAPREMIIKTNWYTPSGMGDGSMGRTEESYILTDKDIIEIKTRGSARDYFREILNIKYELSYKTEFPYVLPKQNKKVKK